MSRYLLVETVSKSSKLYTGKILLSWSDDFRGESLESAKRTAKSYAEKNSDKVYIVLESVSTFYSKKVTVPSYQVVEEKE